MYIYTPLGRYWITLYGYVLGFIVSHVNIQLEDNKKHILNTPRIMNSNKNDARVVIFERLGTTGHSDYRVPGPPDARTIGPPEYRVV